MIVIPIVVVAVIAAVFRVWSPWRPRAQGAPLRTMAMPFVARLCNQAFPLTLLVVAVTVNELIRSVPFWVPVLPLVALALSVIVPARYTLTTEGVSVGALTFRRWTEFSGLTVRRGRIRLKCIAGARPLDIWLPGRFHDADTVFEIRRLIRGAYQGRSAVETTECEPAAVDPESSMAVI